jgi:hypothetical protein
MEFYEEYIPLRKLYPRTFISIETSATTPATMAEVVLNSNFVPPARLSDEWDEALDEYDGFMTAAPGLKPRRKLIALKKIVNAWVRSFLGFRFMETLNSSLQMPFLDAACLKLGVGADNFANMLFALDNKVKQYVQTLGMDPDTRDDDLPANVEEFQIAIASYRELRRGGKVIIVVPDPVPAPAPEPPKKSTSSKKVSPLVSRF